MPTWIKIGFASAAAYNIVGITLFSRGFTNEVLFTTDPALFSRAACVVVAIWGLAYLSLAPHADKAPYVSLAFALEKAFYAAWWLRWIIGHSAQIPDIAAHDPLAGSFYAVYGLGDASFMVFFAAVFAKYRPRS